MFFYLLVRYLMDKTRAIFFIHIIIRVVLRHHRKTPVRKFEVNARDAILFRKFLITIGDLFSKNIEAFAKRFGNDGISTATRKREARHRNI